VRIWTGFIWLKIAARGHGARTEEGRGVCRILIGRPEGTDRWEDIGVGGRITLRLSLWR